MNEWEAVAQEIKKVSYVVVFSGAGLSAASGIPTFRGEGGLWEKYDPSIFASVSGLLFALTFKPQKLISFFLDVGETILNAQPNPAHEAIAQLEDLGLVSSVITQNIDNLHQKAGSKKVIELHGNVYKWRCRNCNKIYKMGEEELQQILNSLRGGKQTRRTLLELFNNVVSPCSCGGSYQLGVVFFGQSLPEEEMDKSYEELAKADILLLVGTSGVVEPAASLPQYAKDKGATLIEINPEESPFSSLCKYALKNQVEDILPQITSCLKE